MSPMFSSTARVCARMSSTGRPVASRSAPAMESSARRALVPDTKMKSPARRKCGNVPRGLALPGITALCTSLCIPTPLELHADVHGLGEEAERMRPALAADVKGSGEQDERMRPPLAADARELHPAEGRAQVAQIPVIDPREAHFHLA